MSDVTTTEARLSDLDLAALLCSRVCHDVISPVGAIANAALNRPSAGTVTDHDAEDGAGSSRPSWDF